MMSSASSRGLSLGYQIVNYGNVEKTIRRAVRAETARFDTVAIPDHLFHSTGSEEYLMDPPQEAFSILGVIAQRIEEMTLIPGATDSMYRHPTELARVTTTFDRMTDSRAGLDIGAGEASNFAPILDIDWDDPYTRFRECVAVIGSLWNSMTDELFSFAGDYFDLDEVHMRLSPVQEPRPPLWIGGYDESIRGLTGAVVDSRFSWIYSPNEYTADFRKVLDMTTDRGRDPDATDHMVMVPTTVFEDGSGICAAGTEHDRVNLVLRPPLLVDMGYEDIAESTPIMWRMTFGEGQECQLSVAVEHVLNGAIDDICVADDPECVTERIEAFRDAGVNNLVLILVGNYEEMMQYYENGIIPCFNERQRGGTSRGVGR